MSYIPNLEFITALLPPVTLAILRGSRGMLIGVVVGYLVINFVADSVFKPKILTRAVDLPVAVSFLSLLVWGFVLGPIGALLAVPMTMMVRTVLLEGSPETEPFALMLRSGGPALTRRGLLWWLREARAGGRRQRPDRGALDHGSARNAPQVAAGMFSDLGIFLARGPVRG
jgi:hypothetical protein